MMTFRHAHAGEPGQFVGLENYIWVVTNDLFVYAFALTIGFVAGTTFLQLALGLLAALLLNELREAAKDWVGALIMSPYFSAPLAGGVIWMWFLDNDFGFVVKAFGIIGVDPPSFLATGMWPFISLIVAQTWHDYAYSAIIYAAAIASIPKEQYEAAAQSGANRLQRFRDVTVPRLLIPTIVILSLRTAWNIAEFSQPFALTGGGPVDEDDDPQHPDLPRGVRRQQLRQGLHHRHGDGPAVDDRRGNLRESDRRRRESLRVGDPSC